MQSYTRSLIVHVQHDPPAYYVHVEFDSWDWLAYCGLTSHFTFIPHLAFILYNILFGYARCSKREHGVILGTDNEQHMSDKQGIPPRGPS